MKNTMEVPQKLKIELAVIPQSHSWAYTWTKLEFEKIRVHSSTVPTAQTRKQPKCPLTEEWIKKMCLHIQWNTLCVCESSFPLLCLNFCGPMYCRPPGSSVHGISQARILEWVAVFFSRGFSLPRDQTGVSCIGRQFLYCWATRKAPLFTDLIYF